MDEKLNICHQNNVVYKQFQDSILYLTICVWHCPIHHLWDHHFHLLRIQTRLLQLFKSYFQKYKKGVGQISIQDELFIRILLWNCNRLHPFFSSFPSRGLISAFMHRRKTISNSSKSFAILQFESICTWSSSNLIPPSSPSFASWITLINTATRRASSSFNNKIWSDDYLSKHKFNNTWDISRGTKIFGANLVCLTTRDIKRYQILY